MAQAPCWRSTNKCSAYYLQMNHTRLYRNKCLLEDLKRKRLSRYIKRVLLHKIHMRIKNWRNKLSWKKDKEDQENTLNNEPAMNHNVSSSLYSLLIPSSLTTTSSWIMRKSKLGCLWSSQILINLKLKKLDDKSTLVDTNTNPHGAAIQVIQFTFSP